MAAGVTLRGAQAAFFDRDLDEREAELSGREAPRKVVTRVGALTPVQESPNPSMTVVVPHDHTRPVESKEITTPLAQATCLKTVPAGTAVTIMGVNTLASRLAAEVSNPSPSNPCGDANTAGERMLTDDARLSLVNARGEPEEAAHVDARMSPSDPTVPPHNSPVMNRAPLAMKVVVCGPHDTAVTASPALRSDGTNVKRLKSVRLLPKPKAPSGLLPTENTHPSTVRATQ